jgi:hypothetical protein
VLRLAPTHLGWGTRRQFTRRPRDPPVSKHRQLRTSLFQPFPSLNLVTSTFECFFSISRDRSHNWDLHTNLESPTSLYTKRMGLRMRIKTQMKNSKQESAQEIQGTLFFNVSHKAVMTSCSLLNCDTWRLLIALSVTWSE